MTFNAACRHLQRHAGAPAGFKPPWPDTRMARQHLQIGIQENDIDGETHTRGVYTPASSQQQPLLISEPGLAQQTLQTVEKTVRHLHLRPEHLITPINYALLCQKPPS